MALDSGAHVLVEKPAGIGVTQIDRLIAHRSGATDWSRSASTTASTPASAGLTEARSGAFGDILYLRARYGHGGRLGYEREWRTDPARSGGGEIIDQGMHLLDISHWLLGELPVQSSLLKTHFWRAAVDDNAVMILADSGGVGDRAPWALLHVSWTEWKNMFSMEVTCERAKWAVEGLSRSYGAQRLSIYRMRPELGPPDLEEHIPTRISRGQPSGRILPGPSDWASRYSAASPTPITRGRESRTPTRIHRRTRGWRRH